MAHRKHVMMSFIAAAVLVTTFGSWSQTSAPTFGGQLRGLTAEQQQAFDEGLDEFLEVETIEEGLGPVFNGPSCVGCHGNPAVGGRLRSRGDAVRASRGE
jgi:hypothetical protein